MEKGNYFVSTEEHCFCKNIIIYGYLRLAELGVLWHIFQLKGLQGAHGDDGVVSEQRFALLGFIHNTRKVSHYKIVIIKLFIFVLELGKSKKGLQALFEFNLNPEVCGKYTSSSNVQTKRFVFPAESTNYRAKGH